METGQPGDWEDNEQLCISDEALLDMPSFPSALQVFAGVGGLALLAEHLPLLYPEVSRQVTPPGDTSNKDGLNSTTSLMDWVTLESNDDIYEVSLFYFTQYDIYFSIHSCTSF